ncbi:RINT-1 family protein [Hymenopellis radicata]|nr:RINT-1 family protein [Hymenopellis radicata]
MSSEQIQSLLAGPSIDQANSKAALFFNSKYHTLEDLAQLDGEVAQSRSRRDELQATLELSQSNVNALLEETRAAAEEYRLAAQELSLQRHALADELSTLTRNLVSSLSDADGQPTLLEDIETMHRNLKELNHVRSYVQVIEYALRLSAAAVEQISTPPLTITESSISNYKELYHFAARVSDACSEVEGDGKQSVNLVNFLEKLRDKTWSDIKSTFTTTLLSVAEKLKWPMPMTYFSSPEEDRHAFERAFRNLLELQILWTVSFGALVLPLSMRFKYHFEGTRQTNQLHKPEWYFTHVLNLVNDHRSFMETVVQQLISPTKYNSINAWHEFTLLLLPLPSRKLRRTIPSLLSHPSLLAHTIYQALSFDAALTEEEFTISDTSAGLLDDNDWEGVVQVILGKKEWFDAWIEGEKRFTEDQFHDIIGASDAWQIADDEDSRDSLIEREMQTTNSARRIAALRTRFLLSVQLPILQLYHGRMSSSLDAFETLSSALVRSVPGGLGVSIGTKDHTSVNVDTQALTSGVAGVQRLCKALLSARYIELSMETWGEQLFFLELWTEINARPSLRARAQAHPLLPDPSGNERDISETTIFDVLTAQYRKLFDRAHDVIVQHVCIEVESSLKAHISAMISNPNPDAHIAVSQTLLAPIALLSTHLAYIRSTVPVTSLTSLYRRIATRLSEHIMQRQILYRGNVSLTEAKYIHAECELWVETSHGALAGALGGGRNRVESPWSKLLEAGRLIAAEGDSWTKAVDSTFGTAVSEGDWETHIVDVTGYSELSREEVGRILRRRTQ